MRALAVLLVSLLCGPGFGCKKAGKPAGGGGSGSAAVDAAAVAPVAVTPAVDAAPPSPCAGMWVHSDPDFCLAVTGPADYSIELVRAPKAQHTDSSEATVYVSTDARYDHLLEAMAEWVTQRGVKVLEQGDLPNGKWMLWIEPPANGSSSRFRAVVHFGGHAYQCETYWQPRGKRELLIDENGHDRAPNIEFCKSLAEAPAAGCPGQWSQVDPAFCARKPDALTASYQIHFPQTFKGMHINVYEDDTWHDTQVARLERDAKQADDNEFISQGELPGGQWKHWRNLFEGETLSYEVRSVQRLGHRTYECYVEWPLIAKGQRVPIELDDPQLTAAIAACKSLRAP